MKDRLCLFFCDYLQQEVEYLLDQEHAKDVSLVFYRNNCDHFSGSTELFNSLIKQSEHNSVTLFASACLTSLVKKLTTENINIEPLEDCLQLLIPERLMQALIDEGAHIFTSGMLKHWDTVNNSWGFSDEQQRAFFKESTTKLVLITHPDITTDETTMAAIAQQLDLPWETLDVSLVHLSEQLFKVIGRWRAEVTVDKSQQLADYAMVNDLIAQVASLKEEKQVIKQVLELFHMFCEPGSASYLAIESGVAGKLEVTIPILDEAVERKKLLAVDQHYTLDKANNGFQLLIERGGEKIGVFGIYKVAFPQYLNHYLNLARNIAPVIALSIGNARVYQQQLQAEIDIRHLNSQLGEQLKQVNHLNKELNLAQVNLIQAEKMVAVGQLAAGVAHEINTPLGYIHSNLNTLHEYIGDLWAYIGAANQASDELNDNTPAKTNLSKMKDELDIDFIREDIEDLLTESLEGASKVKGVIENLREFTGIDKQKTQNVCIEEGLEATLTILEDKYNEEISIVKEFSGVQPINANAAQLNQVFMGIVLNAIESIDGQGTIYIRTSMNSNQWVCIEIEDTGIGIPKEIQGKVFDPFFTNKPIGDGVGLGLSVAYQLIDAHKGKISIDSTVGKGTKVSIILPICS